MNANCAAAFWTSVLLGFVIEELLHSVVSNDVQILNHAHAVVLPITFVKSIEV
jgi:hypothetical protein